MAAVWSDRLAEVWAPPGKAGTGFVLGDDTVVTARHLLAGASAGDPVLARVVRPGELVAAGWVPMQVAADDEAWDIAILRPDPASSGSLSAWLRPGSLVAGACPAGHCGRARLRGCRVPSVRSEACRAGERGDPAD